MTDQRYWDERTERALQDPEVFANDARFDQAMAPGAKLILPYVYGSVLDVGCGFGRFAAMLHYDSYVGYDPTSARIEVAKKRFEHLPNVRFTDTWDEVPKQVDVAFTVTVLQHLPFDTAKSLVNRMRSVARDLCFIESFTQDNGRHMFAHDPKELFQAYSRVGRVYLVRGLRD